MIWMDTNESHEFAVPSDSGPRFLRDAYARNHTAFGSSLAFDDFPVESPLLSLRARCVDLSPRHFLNLFFDDVEKLLDFFRTQIT